MSFIVGSTISYSLDGESLIFGDSHNSHGADELTLLSVGHHNLSMPVEASGVVADLLASFLLHHGGTLIAPPPVGGGGGGIGGAPE